MQALKGGVLINFILLSGKIANLIYEHIGHRDSPGHFVDVLARAVFVQPRTEPNNRDIAYRTDRN